LLQSQRQVRFFYVQSQAFWVCVCMPMCLYMYVVCVCLWVRECVCMRCAWMHICMFVHVCCVFVRLHSNCSTLHL
jgi:hypothetical protein